MTNAISDTPSGPFYRQSSSVWRESGIWRAAMRFRQALLRGDAGRVTPSPLGDSVEAPGEGEVALDLVQRILSGDRTAETKLVERYSRGLLYMLRRTTGNMSLADDLHQETFRIVLERLRTRGLDEPEKLTGFIHRTARNLFIASYRKAIRRQTQPEDAVQDFVDPAPNQLGRVLDQEEARLVRQLIAELTPDRDRQLLTRFYLGDEGKEEICRDLGLSSLHFNRVLFRARQRFKDLLLRFDKRQRP